MVRFSVPMRAAYSDNSRTGACSAFSRCGLGLFGYFFSRLSFLFFSGLVGWLILGLTAL